MKILVSIIIPTKNEESNIETCLKSIKNQSYRKIETIVVDNNSTDRTKEIAKKYTMLVFNKGPERSAQRNYGAKTSKGKYVLFIDADMVLTKNVVKDCVDKIEKLNVGGIIIPEESYGTSFWAKCKKLERSFYVGNDFIEAGRFFNKKVFNSIGGFDLSITGPEDWDLSQRIKEEYGLGRVNSFIKHNEGNLLLFETIKKKYYYSKKFSNYMEKKENKKYYMSQMNLFRRYYLFFSKPKKLFKNPIVGVGMLFMKTAEFIAGGIGFLITDKFIE